MNTSVRVLAVLAVLASLKLAAPLLLPIVLSVLLFYALAPVVDRLDRWGVPRMLASFLTVLALVGVVSGGVKLMWPQLEAVVDDIPARAKKLGATLDSWRGSPTDSPLQKMEAAAKAIDSAAAAAGNPDVQTPGVISVEVKQPWRASELLWSSGIGLVLMTGQVVTILFLTAFLLNESESFKAKLVKHMPTRGERRVTIEVLGDISTQMRVFLWVQAVTSLVVGVATFLMLWAFGVSQPAVWGLLAGLLNVVPYFGPLIVTTVICAVALVQFGDIPKSLLIAAGTLAVTSLEGYVLTPLLLSRTASLNPVAIFVSIAFWSWAWGVVGMLLAVPILMAVKAVCDHVPGFQTLSLFLGQKAR